MKVTRLNLSIDGSGQTIHYKELLKAAGDNPRAMLWSEKLSIEIKSDSVPFQSYAVVNIYDPAAKKWNLLASIHHDRMKTPHGIGYRPIKPCEADFFDDVEELLRLATLILC